MADTPRDRSGWLASLEMLRDGPNPERLESVARQALGTAPEDPDYHYYLAEALLAQDQHKEAAVSYDVMRAADPTSNHIFWIGLRIAFTQSSSRRLRSLAAEALSHYPEEGGFHYYAAVGDALSGKLNKARTHLARARAIDPDDPDYLAFQSRLGGVASNSAKHSWERLAELEAGLAVDPESAQLHNAMGDVYVDELDDFRLAEKSYGEAVRLEPQNRTFQRDLFSAIARRSLLYRVLNLPGAGFSFLRQICVAFARNPLYLILLVAAGKLLLGFLLWLLLVTPLFYPGAKFYEWLVICQLRDARSLSGPRGWLFSRIRPIPKLVRWVLFFALSSGVWALIFWGLKVPLGAGFKFAGWVLGIHIAIVVILSTYRQLRARCGKARAKKSERLVPG